MNQRLRAIVLMVAASAFLQLPVTSPALRMLSPLMLAHARPNDEPRPTRTPRPPEPTDTPRPTRTLRPPEPTDTPRPTRTLRPTRAPEATDTPEPTRTPKPTSIRRPPRVSDFKVRGYLFGSDTSSPGFAAAGGFCPVGGGGGLPGNCFAFSGWFRVPRGVTVVDPKTQPTQFSLIAVGPGAPVTLASTVIGGTPRQRGLSVRFNVVRNVEGRPTFVRFKARRTPFGFCTTWPSPAVPPFPAIPCVNSSQCTGGLQCVGFPVTSLPGPLRNVELILSASVGTVGFTAQTQAPGVSPPYSIPLLTCSPAGVGNLRCSR